MKNSRKKKGQKHKVLKAPELKSWVIVEKTSAPYWKTLIGQIVGVTAGSKSRATARVKFMYRRKDGSPLPKPEFMDFPITHLRLSTDFKARINKGPKTNTPPAADEYEVVEELSFIERGEEELKNMLKNSGANMQSVEASLPQVFSKEQTAEEAEETIEEGEHAPTFDTLVACAEWREVRDDFKTLEEAQAYMEAWKMMDWTKNGKRATEAFIVPPYGGKKIEYSTAPDLPPSRHERHLG